MTMAWCACSLLELDGHLTAPHGIALLNDAIRSSLLCRRGSDIDHLCQALCQYVIVGSFLHGDAFV